MAVSLGFPFGVLVSCGALAGTYLDKRWATGPWLTLLGILLGAIGAFVNMLRVVRALNEHAIGDGDNSDNSNDDESRNGEDSSPPRLR